MDDLQATIEIAVDLGKFYNVDLFQRGFYQVAVKLTEPVHPQAKLEVHILKTEDKDYFCPSRVSDDGLGAVSKCLQVLYKREECQLNHTFLFRVHCLLDSQRIMECLKKLSFQLEVTLCFSSADDMPEDLSKMEEVCKRTLKLELDLIYGLYAYTLILFDYGYMAAIEACIHASLVALHQPLMTGIGSVGCLLKVWICLYRYAFVNKVFKPSKQLSIDLVVSNCRRMPGLTPNGGKIVTGVEPVTLESILFRALPGMSAGQALSMEIKISNAISVHAKLVKILLTVYAHMQNYYLKLLRSIPRKNQETYVLSNLQQISSRMYAREFLLDLDSLVIVSVDVNQKLKDMTMALKHISTLEEIINQVNMNLASTCSLLLALWSHVLETSCLNKQVRKHLSREFHTQRVHRFQSGFFTTENPRNSSFDEGRHGVYNWMASEIRASRWFAELPNLRIHCDEADGSSDTLPIIFEDVYTHQCKKEPVFRSRTAISVFNRVPAASAQQPADSHNGILSVQEEQGHEEKYLESPNSSVSSCGEACENTFVNGKEDSGGHQRKRSKYGSIFRKRKGSYKPNRAERISVSDDESTKVTLAEFLSTIEAPVTPAENSTKNKSSALGLTKSKSSASTNSRQNKLKNSHSVKGSKSKKSFAHHRRSLDEGAQRLLQLVKVRKRSMDDVDNMRENENLPRSLSSSILDQGKNDSSTASSHTSLDNSCDENSDDLVTNAMLDKGNESVRRGFATTASRSVENRFRMQIRSETSEEPESGISEKMVPRTNSLFQIQVTATTVTKTTSTLVTQAINKTPSVAKTEATPKHNVQPTTVFHGMTKSQSYATGIERLQKGTDETAHFPRPHAHLCNSLSHDSHNRLKNSQTAFGGLDRVRYGMGLHPGASTITTTDLSPFDEPELIQAWGELSTSSPLRDTPSVESSPDSSQKSEASSSNVRPDSIDETLTNSPLPTTSIDANQDQTLTILELTTANVRQAISNDPDPNKDNEHQNATETSENCTDTQTKSKEKVITSQNGYEELTRDSVVGSFFFREQDMEEDGVFTASVQGCTLPKEDFTFDRTHSMRGFAGSLECSEEPNDITVIEDLKNLETEAEKKLRNLFMEPLQMHFSGAAEEEVNHNIASTQQYSSEVNVKHLQSGPLSKSNGSSKTPRDKALRTLGGVTLSEAESSLSITTELLNTMPPIHTLKERRSMAEKSRLFGRLHFPGFSYTDIPPVVTPVAYLSQKNVVTHGLQGGDGCHLVICVHGLDGNCNDLRLVRTYIQLAVPASTSLAFMMAKCNQDDTYANIDTMTERLVSEILEHLRFNFSGDKLPSRISFIGHSLGCLLIRSVVANDRMRHLRSRFFTFLSFSGPHLGTIFNDSTLVKTGLWLIQKWKKSACLLQLACKDHADLRKTYIYKLSKKRGLEFFRNILLVASAADRYVPYHSARLEMCKQSFRDKTIGPPYQEMLNNIMKPVLNKQKLNLVRYHIVHALPSATANTMIGRAAHIAVLDSEVFLEKFLLVSAIRYFI